MAYLPLQPSLIPNWSGTSRGIGVTISFSTGSGRSPRTTGANTSTATTALTDRTSDRDDAPELPIGRQ